MLTFTPQYHTQITTGELADSWAPLALPGVRSYDAWYGLIHEEASRIKQEGGTLAYFNPKAGPADDEMVRELQAFLNSQS